MIYNIKITIKTINLLNISILFGLINLAYCFIFFKSYLYLPSPFMMDKNDTLMDFYNPLYWAMNDGFYSIFNSVYPAVNYFLLKSFAYFFDIKVAESPFELRGDNLTLSAAIIAIYLLTVFISVNIGRWRSYSLRSRILFFLIFAMSAPVLYALERGNTIFFALLFFSFYINTECDKKKALYLAFLVNIKPYFIILFIQYLNKNTFNKAFLFYAILFSVAIFIITGLIAQIDFLRFFKSYLIFSQTSSLSSLGVLSLTHSISTLTFFSEYTKIFNLFGYESSFRFWYSSIKALNIFTILFLVLICIITKISKRDLLIAAVVILTNFSVSTGGYVLIFYIPIFSYLLADRRYSLITLSIIGMFVIPWDWFPIYSLHFDSMTSYLGESSNLSNLNLTFGLGAIVRPALNYFIVVNLIFLLSKNLSFTRFNRY